MAETSEPRAVAPVPPAAAWLGPRQIGVAAALAIVIAVLVGAATRHSWLLWLEHSTGDTRTALLSDRAPAQHPRLALVMVTEETLDRHPYRTPVDRALLAGLVRMADAAGAAAIGLDFLVLRPTEPAKDERLLAALADAKAPVVIAAADARTGLPPRQGEHQAAALARIGRPAGYANLLVGRDDVVRHIPAAADTAFPVSFAAQLAAASPTPGGAARRDSAARPLSEPLRIAWLLPPRDGADLFLTIPAHALVEASGEPRAGSQVDRLAALLRGRIVIIGADLDGSDQHRVPVATSSSGRSPGAQIQAQVVAQLLDGRRVGRIPDPILWVLIAAFGFVGVLAGRARGILGYSLYGGMATAAIVALDAFAFVALRSVLPFMSLLAALVLGIVAGAVLRRALGWGRLRRPRAVPDA